MTADTTAILNERGPRHGTNATAQFTAAQELKAVVRRFASADVNPTQIEALDMICVKMSRILQGDPTYDDHWDDIAGYAMVAKRENNKEE